MAIRVLCAACGSKDVARDAWARWDVDAQEWVLEAILDDSHCHQCDAAATLVEQPVLTIVSEMRALTGK